jgi:hypothetical protein
MRKVIGFLFLLGVLSNPAYSVEEYTIDETVKVYDQGLNELQTEITYYPSNIDSWGINKPVFLYYRDFFGCTLIFGKFRNSNYDAKTAFIEIIEKCIEWADVAKKNNVHTLSKTVKSEMEIPFTLGSGNGNDFDVFLVDFIFSIQEINGKEETMLIANLRTVRQVNNEARGSYIAFKEKDFVRLKTIFSDSYLAQFDQKAEKQAKQEKLFQ